MLRQGGGHIVTITTSLVEQPIAALAAEITKIVEDYSAWLCETEPPKLFVNANPGAALQDEHRAFCRTWPNQTEVTVLGLHFVQECWLAWASEQ